MRQNLEVGKSVTFVFSDGDTVSGSVTKLEQVSNLLRIGSEAYVVTFIQKNPDGSEETKDRAIWVKDGKIQYAKCYENGVKCPMIQYEVSEIRGSSSEDSCNYSGEIHMVRLKKPPCTESVICSGQINCSSDTEFKQKSGSSIWLGPSYRSQNATVSCIAQYDKAKNSYSCPGPLACATDTETDHQVNLNGSRVSTPNKFQSTTKQ